MQFPKRPFGSVFSSLPALSFWQRGCTRVPSTTVRPLGYILCVGDWLPVPPRWPVSPLTPCAPALLPRESLRWGTGGTLIHLFVLSLKFWKQFNAHAGLIFTFRLRHKSFSGRCRFCCRHPSCFLRFIRIWDMPWPLYTALRECWLSTAAFLLLWWLSSPMQECSSSSIMSWRSSWGHQRRTVVVSSNYRCHGMMRTNTHLCTYGMGITHCWSTWLQIKFQPPPNLIPLFP